MNLATDPPAPVPGRLRRRLDAAWRSLSLRLLGIFALTTVASLVVLVVFFTKGLGSQWRDTIEPHFVQYLSYIQQDLGNPPDPARARALSDRLPLGIVIYRGDTLLFSSDVPVPPVRRLRYDRVPLTRMGRGSGAERPQGTVAINRSGGRRDGVLRFERDGHTVYYRFGRRDGSRGEARSGPRGAHDTAVGPADRSTSSTGDRGRPSGHRDGDGELLWALLALAAVMGAGYWLLRRLLSPIGRIRHGVARMTAGELGERIGLRGHDDLAVLGNSIDTLAERIEAMLGAKRQLLLALSHELRSPLARARLALQLLPESSRRDAIEEDLLEMQSLIGDIMESEQLQQPHTVLNRAPVDLVELVRNEADGHSEVDVRIDAGALPEAAADGRIVLEADAARLRILVRNLVANALSHGRAADGSASVGVTLRAGLDEVRIEVSDTGPGIHPDHLARITDPLYRPDASRTRTTGGFGLGLTLARLIAEAHGGRLDIDSEPARGPGVRVRVVLPA